MIVAVTGALGFIGHHLVQHLLKGGSRCYLIDAETYAANPALLDTWERFLTEGWLEYVHADIATVGHLPDVDAVINLAAETHVDNSIADSRRFVWSNVMGVHNLLELVRGKRHYEIPRFIQISTDEVYGSVGQGVTDELAPLNPSSPYAASKAAADLLIQGYAATHGMPYNLIRPSNCYGTGQYPEKLIPKAVRYFGLGKAMPVHDTGEHQRSWLAVEDCATAIQTVLEHGERNQTYNIGGNTVASVAQVVNAVAEHFEKPAVRTGFARANVDGRYCVDDTKLRSLGWQPQGDLFRDLPQLVASERSAWRW